MRAFVREEIWPIETIDDEIGQAELDRIYAPLQEQVKERGLWAAHLPPELGGQGFGQVKLGLMNEILGTSIYAPNAFGCQAPDSGNSEILALAGTAGAEGALALPAARRRAQVRVLDDRAGDARLRPDAAAHARRARRRRLRPQRAQVVHVERIDRRLPHRHGGHRPDAKPHRRASMFIVPVDTPGVNIVRDVPNMEHPQQHFGMLGGHTEIVYDGVRLGHGRAARRARATAS